MSSKGKIMVIVIVIVTITAKDRIEGHVMLSSNMADKVEVKEEKEQQEEEAFTNIKKGRRRRRKNWSCEIA